MILCLDAGNSRLKYGLFDGTAWRRREGLEYRDLEQRLGELTEKPTRLIACNVAGELMKLRIVALADTLALPVEWFTSAAAACGVTNGYDSPKQLGADRWAALIGARALHPQPCVVVLAGTATTIDVLDRDGRFRGGLILAGLSLMRSALARNTADLPHAAGQYRPRPTNTDDAIVSGAIHATLGAIERVRATLGADVPCLLSGGTAAELAPRLGSPHRLIDHLVLEGLARYSQVSAAAR